jgi:hypothetical protein
MQDGLEYLDVKFKIKVKKNPLKSFKWIFKYNEVLIFDCQLWLLFFTIDGFILILYSKFILKI